MKNSSPLVSAIITSRNEEDVIEMLLRSVKRQTYKNIEIVVVDNNSTDITKKIAKRYTNVVVNKGPERSAQRNFGRKRAHGVFLIFLDADMELSDSVIEACVTKMKKNADAVIIPEISVGNRFWEKVKAFERSFYVENGSYLTDAARFFRATTFDTIGGYDDTITGTEDWDLSERVRKSGFKIVRIQTPIYHHERIPSLWKHARKFYYYGFDADITLKKQRTRVFSPKTIHFLRPAFYKNWKKMLFHPFLTCSMGVMLAFQILFGGIGFLVGKYERRSL